MALTVVADSAKAPKKLPLHVQKRHGSLRKVQLFPHGTAGFKPGPVQGLKLTMKEGHDFCICPMGKGFGDRHQEM